MKLNELLEFYSSMKYKIFACHMDKSPATPHGFKDATVELNLIEKWWSKWPDANIGVATGSESFIVLDLDLPDGPNNLEALKKKHGKLPKTLTSITGSGGRHLFFKTPNLNGAPLAI